MGRGALVRLPFVHTFRDRHGKVRRYFRYPSLASASLPGTPGSAEFMTAYNAALSGQAVSDVGASRSAPGTISAAIAGYYCDNAFTSLAPTTQKMRRAILENFRADHGTKRLSFLEPNHLASMLGKKKPFAARNWLKTLRGLMQFAVGIGLRED